MDITPFSEVWGTLSKLTIWYFSHAWLFLLLHVALGVLIYRGPVRRIRSEIRSLNAWPNGNGKAGEGCAGVLTQFADDAALWGEHGILVPMTDFSDRLDSLVTGLVDDLRSRINLFLIIGIAGTFFALFQFASDASLILPSPDAGAGGKLSIALAQALAYAFPVGFVGLMLTMLGHLLAAGLERRYRAALTNATQTALGIRRKTCKGNVQAIVEALAPLRNLEDTLRDSLQPVIEGFRDQLRETSNIIESQFAPLAGAVAGMQSAVAAFAAATAALDGTLRGLPHVLREIEDLQRESRRGIERTAELLGVVADAVMSSCAELRRSAEMLASLPERLAFDFREQLTLMARSASEVWNDTSKEFLRQVEPATAALGQAASELQSAASSLSTVPAALRTEMEHQVARMMDECSRIFTQAAQQLVSTLGPLEAAVRQSAADISVAAHDLSKTSEEIRDVFSTELENLLKESQSVWTKTSTDFFAELQRRLITFLDAVREDTAKAEDSLSAAARELNTVAGNITITMRDGVSGAITAATEQLRPHLLAIDEALVKRYPAGFEALRRAMDRSDDLLAGVTKALTGIEVVLAQVEAGREAWAAVRNEMDRILRELQGKEFGSLQEPVNQASAGVRQISATLMHIESHYLPQLVPRPRRWWPFHDSHDGKEATR